MVTNFLIIIFFRRLTMNNRKQIPTWRSLLFRVFRITKRPAFTSCERSSYCSPKSTKSRIQLATPFAVTIPPRKEAGFLATPAKIIRPPTRREVEDFNLYRNAKRGFKRANNAFSPFNTPPPYIRFRFCRTNCP